MFSIKEYNKHLSSIRQGKREHSSGFHLDFRVVLSLCVKYYEIEERLIRTAKDYEDFIQYFTKDKIVFDKLLVLIKKFKGNYKNVTRYITHYFKNDKINNLFVCTKIILFFKILHFDIPETLHNKLIIQVHDTEENNKAHSYIDNNYYMILNYVHGEFVIKFISHELLIVLEYSEDELRDQDFHVLLPDKLRRLHRNAVINEIKSRTPMSYLKEIFFVSKKQTCVLFDIQYKFLLNLRGEITLLTVVNLKKPSKDVRICFACIDEHGEVLALNKEFEEFLVLSMRVLDFVKIDTEKIILQGMGERMRKFFKDEENTDFQEQFDYEQYLSSLFDEEFEILKEKNEKEYRRKYARWEVLKEMNRKGRYYTRYIELNVKQRCLGREKIYFLKYSVKITLSLRSIEPHSTTLSLIHAVKISKREMAKLSFYRGDEIYESKSEKSINEEKVNESHDDLFESQSQISSAVSQLKERNSVRLFRQKRSNFKFLPKSRNIFFLMISIGVLAIVSVVYNIVTLVLKNTMYKNTHKFLTLDLNALFFKKNIFYISTAISSLVLAENGIIAYTSDFIENLQSAIEIQSYLINEVTYNISFLSSQFYNKNIDSLLNSEETLRYIFENGYIYEKENAVIYQEASNIKKFALDLLNKYEDGTASLYLLEDYRESIMYKYFFMKKIEEMQNSISSLNLEINEQDVTSFFVMENLFEKIENFTNVLIDNYDNNLQNNKNTTTKSIIIIKIIEFLLIGFIISIEWSFIYFGYEKAKKKMIHLRQKVERNNIDFTLKKIEEFVHFSNNFNIGSLYYIADLDLKKIDESSKTIDASNTGSKSFNTLISTTSTPRKKNIQHFYSTQNLRDESVSLNSQTEPNSTFNLREDLKAQSQKNLHDFPIDGEKTPQNEPDGKKNLLKVMHKLDQIKGIKKTKDFEKKDTDKSKQSNESSNVYNSENVNNLASVVNFVSGEDSKNKSGVDSDLSPDTPGKVKQLSGVLKQEPVKPALRGGKTGNIRFNVDNDIGSQTLHEEDSKIPMIKQNGEEGIGLVKKTVRTTKVQFKGKNVRFFSPGQNVNEAVENGNQSKPSELERKEQSDRVNNNDVNINRNNNINNNPLLSNSNINSDSKRIPSTLNISSSMRPKDKSLLSAIQTSSFSSSLPGMGGKMRFDPRMGKKLSSAKELPNDIQLADLKENNQFNKYQLIEQGRAVTVKKRQEVNEKDITKKEIIEDKIENVVHNNFIARLILNITLISFIIIYVVSIALSFIYNTTISHASTYSHLLVNKTTLLNMLMLNYQYSVIQNEHNDLIYDLISQSEENTKEVSNFEVHEDPNVLPTVFNLEKELEKNTSCEYFSKQYTTLIKSEYFSSKYSGMVDSEYEKELDKCNTIGDSLNANGMKKAESYVRSTMIVYVEDWKNIKENNIEVNEELIMDKLNDNKFLNIINEVQYIFRKYGIMLMQYILQDVEDIFDKILFNEQIFGYLSICFNIIFLVLSLVFIIYPIKSVEMMISWLIHKIMKN